MTHKIYRDCVRAGRSSDPRWRAMFTIACLAIPGCASAPLERSGSLSSYDNLKRHDGLITKSLVHADSASLKDAKTAKLVPIGFSGHAARAGLSDQERHLVANAATRALCNSLSRKFRIMPPDQPADLIVSGTITYIATTDGVASAASQAASVATSVLLPVPLPTPRIPIGMGGLSVEAEARDAQGRQVAAVVWARGADAFTTKARVSKVGDAYGLVTEFSDDFSHLLKTGTVENSPASLVAAMPSFDDIAYAIDGKPKASACAAYGDGPGLLGAIGANVGTPPEWTDKGGARQSG